jgi:hypothetical protein
VQEWSSLPRASKSR